MVLITVMMVLILDIDNEMADEEGGDDDFGFVVLIGGVGRVGAVIREDAVPSFNVSSART